MDCFKNLRELKRVKIVGDLEKEYFLEFAAAVKFPKTIFNDTGCERPSQ